MKATISHDGMLSIRAETNLESYALSRWLDEHTDQLAAYPAIVFWFGEVDESAAPAADSDANRQRLR